MFLKKIQCKRPLKHSQYVAEKKIHTPHTHPHSPHPSQPSLMTPPSSSLPKLPSHEKPSNPWSFSHTTYYQHQTPLHHIHILPQPFTWISHTMENGQVHPLKDCITKLPLYTPYVPLPSQCGEVTGDICHGLLHRVHHQMLAVAHG